MRIGIIGGGIAGLTAGALASRIGHDVTVYESSREWGGCAGKFERGDYRFPAGATLGMGFEPGGLHERVLSYLGETIDVRPLPEVMQIHLDGKTVRYHQDRNRFLAELEATFPELAPQIRAFLNEVWADFETIRPLFETLPALPFRTVRDATDAIRAFRLAQLQAFRKLYRPLGTTLSHHRLNGTIFEQVIDGILLDSLQTGAREASHLLAAVALSIYHEGAFYVDGGLYTLAHALERSIRQADGTTLLGRQIVKIEQVADGWLLTDRRGGSTSSMSSSQPFRSRRLRSWSRDKRRASSNDSTAVNWNVHNGGRSVCISRYRKRCARDVRSFNKCIVTTCRQVMPLSRCRLRTIRAGLNDRNVR